MRFAKAMIHSRREFLKAAASAALATAPLAAAARERREQAIIEDQIVRLFENLPGVNAFKIFAPAAEGKPELLAQANPGTILFVASAIKTFILCWALAQADSPDIINTLEATTLVLDSSVWSFGSPTFNSPDVTGIVSERTTLEAMITRSDNTATDMMLKHVGPDNVRNFIAAFGLKNTLIPDSTRAAIGYIFGARDYLTLTWDQLQTVVQGPPIFPFLNNVETFASTADELVFYYSLALQGEFFQYSQTLNEFRRLLTLCDFIYLIPLPLGVSAFAKSGNADFPGFHARSIAGGMFFSDRWVYFAFIINWYTASLNDPYTTNAFFGAIYQALTLVKESLSV
jgi:beta-lactamase class A